ncbi:MAG: ATP-binding cassette domain-containing protein [Solirubrobacterales bacterium]
MSGPLAVSVDNLTRYYGDRAALDGVSFDVPAGSTLVVFGANGAGKSTLLRILSTLLRPHSGEMRLLGEELPKDSWAVRGRIGFIGHDPMLYRDLTARENLLFTAKLYKVPIEEVDRILDRVDLADRSDEPVRTFSRGMTQRLATARALLPDPELLLLDEPLANLDPGAALLLEPFIGRAPHHTRVIVTHDVEYGLEQADIALGLKRGRAEWLQPADRVSESETRRLYK